MTKGKVSARARIVRSPNRAHYDKETLNAVLDTGSICHISYEYEGSPVIIPMAYARIGDMIYIHGASKNRLLNSILQQKQACLAVTHVDALVLARSAYHHSINYRSAVIFGVPEKVDDYQTKMNVLAKITNNILAGRWDEVRSPSDSEMKATLVIGIKIKEASVKIRTGPPIDDDADYTLPIWAGLLPLKKGFEQPIADGRNLADLKVPASVSAAVKQ